MWKKEKILFLKRNIEKRKRYNNRELPSILYLMANIHREFYNRLKKNYPDITPTPFNKEQIKYYMKLCNLSFEDIGTEFFGLGLLRDHPRELINKTKERFSNAYQAENNLKEKIHPFKPKKLYINHGFLVKFSNQDKYTLRIPDIMFQHNNTIYIGEVKTGNYFSADYQLIEYYSCLITSSNLFSFFDIPDPANPIPQKINVILFGYSPDIDYFKQENGPAGFLYKAKNRRIYPFDITVYGKKTIDGFLARIFEGEDNNEF